MSNSELQELRGKVEELEKFKEIVIRANPANPSENWSRVESTYGYELCKLKEVKPLQAELSALKDRASEENISRIISLIYYGNETEELDNIDEPLAKAISSSILKETK